MSLPEQVTRGAKASQLLSNPVYQEAWETVRTAIHDKWEACPVRDTQGAHELRLMLKLLGDLKVVFESAVDDGKMAAVELERLNRKVLTPAQWSGR